MKPLDEFEQDDGYLEKITSTPRLSPGATAQLIELFNAARLTATEDGDSRTGNLIPNGEDFDPEKVVRLGEEAKTTLLRSHLYIVVELSREYGRDYPNIPLSELVKAGTRGLEVAIDQLPLEVPPDTSISLPAEEWIHHYIQAYCIPLGHFTL